MASRRDPGRTTRVGVLGHGSIGSIVASALANGDIEGASLAGVALRPERAGALLPHGAAVTAGDLIDSADVVVEAAGPDALASHAPSFLAAGIDVVAVSSGALIDDEVFDSLTATRPGRLLVCSGAIGGIDMIRAARAMGVIHHASITTTKRPAGLVQDHMPAGEADELRNLTRRKVLFDGGVRELVARFPSSTNVAATLALAVGSWDLVRGTVCADPDATHTTHAIEVTGDAGTYRFEMTNHPSPQNPRSSGVVPWSVICALRELCGSSWGFV